MSTCLAAFSKKQGSVSQVIVTHKLQITLAHPTGLSNARAWAAGTKCVKINRRGICVVNDCAASGSLFVAYSVKQPLDNFAE